VIAETAMATAHKKKRIYDQRHVCDEKGLTLSLRKIVMSEGVVVKKPRSDPFATQITCVDILEGRFIIVIVTPGGP
jgi:hypothetical protein